MQLFEPEPVVSEVMVTAEGEQAPVRCSTKTSCFRSQSFASLRCSFSIQERSQPTAIYPCSLFAQAL